MSTLDDLVQSIPRPILVIGILFGAVVLLLLFNPPHTICDTQSEDFQKRQTGFLYIRPNAKRPKSISIFAEQFENCRNPGDSPGACYTLFSGVRQVMSDVKAVDRSCQKIVGDLPETRKALFGVAELMAKLAWGRKPPTDSIERRGWLDNTDVKMFCDLQSFIKLVYGEPSFEAFRERVMGDLPDAKTLDRKNLWERSLFSETCREPQF